MPTTEPRIMKLSARSTNKLLGVAVASGLAAASLSAVPTANAWCVGLSGININLGGGGGCTSTFGNFSIGLGPNAVANSNGFLTGAIALGDAVADTTGILTAAWAGGTGSQAFTNGIVNWAVAQGTNVVAQAGNRAADFANLAVNFGQARDGATSTVEAGNGAFNLAGNLFGNATNGGADGITPIPLIVRAGGNEVTLGFGTVAANVIGNRNDVEVLGSLANATNWGNLFAVANASDSTVFAGRPGRPAFLSWAFNYQGPFTQACSVGDCGNDVTASDPFSIAGALGVIQQTVTQEGFGITLATRLNTAANSSNVLAASGTQANGVRLNSTGTTTNGAAVSGTQESRFRLNSTGTTTNGAAVSGTQESRVRLNSTGSNEASNRRQTTSPGGSVHKSFSDRTKKFSDGANRGTGGLARGANGADSTSRGDK